MIMVPLEEVDVAKNVQSLPRTIDNSSTISVTMKRKLEYNATHMVQNIDPNVPLKAVQKLKELNNPFYVNIELNQDL